MQENLITIWTFSSEIEAELVKGQLEGSGIPAYIFKDVCGSMYPNLQLIRGIELKVHYSDESQARAVLRGYNIAVVQEADQTSEDIDDDQDIFMIMEAKNLTKKAFFLLIISLGALPGLITLPMSFKYSHRALILLKRASSKRPLLEAAIKAVIIFSGILTLIYVWYGIIYIIKKIDYFFS